MSKQIFTCSKCRTQVNTVDDAAFSVRAMRCPTCSSVMDERKRNPQMIEITVGGVVFRIPIDLYKFIKHQAELDRLAEIARKKQLICAVLPVVRPCNCGHDREQHFNVESNVCSACACDNFVDAVDCRCGHSRMQHFCRHNDSGCIECDCSEFHGTELSDPTSEVHSDVETPLEPIEKEQLKEAISHCVAPCGCGHDKDDHNSHERHAPNGRGLIHTECTLCNCLEFKQVVFRPSAVSDPSATCKHCQKSPSDHIQAAMFCSHADGTVYEPETREMVDHPQHYGGDVPYEVVKVAEAWQLDKDAYLFTTVKYIARVVGPNSKYDTEYGKIEDLRKSRWYLNRRLLTLGIGEDSTGSIEEELKCLEALRIFITEHWGAAPGEILLDGGEFGWPIPELRRTAFKGLPGA